MRLAITEAVERMGLTWESTFAIAMELRRLHPDAKLEEISIQQIYDWTVGLSDFVDEPSLCNDDILHAIYQDWFEENIHGRKGKT